MGSVRQLPVRGPRPRYVELRARSAFSFLRGASLPEELARRAAELGYGAVALGDVGGLYGAPRFHQAAQELGLTPIVAGDLEVVGHGRVRLLVESEAGYRNLCRLFTLAHVGQPKGSHAATLAQLGEYAGGLIALLGECTDVAAAAAVARTLGKQRAVAEVWRHLDPEGERRNRAMRDMAGTLGLA